MNHRLTFGMSFALLALAELPAAAQSQNWIRQFGSSGGEKANGASPDGSGGVYIGGRTAGSVGGPNAGLFDVLFAR